MHSLRIAVFADTSVAEPELHWVALDSAKSILDSGVGNPGRWANTRLIELFLPAANVLLTSLTVPVASRRQLVKILPFALEDQTLAAPEQCHIAAGSGRGRPTIALIARDWFAKILAQLAAVGVSAQGAYSLADCLPFVENEWHGYLTADGGYLSTGGGGFSFDWTADAPPPELLLAFRGANELPQRIVLHLARDIDSARLQPWVEQLPVEVRLNNSWDWRTAAVAGNAVNLLQGTFSPSAELNIDWRQYRLPVALVAALGCVYVGNVVGDYWSLSRQYKSASAAVEREARKTIPAGPLIDPVAQLQRKLQDVRQSGAGGLLASAQRLAPLIAPQQANSMRFAAGELLLQIRVSDAAQADALQKRIEAAGLRAERKGLAPNNGAFVVDLAVRGLQ